MDKILVLFIVLLLLSACVQPEYKPALEQNLTDIYEEIPAIDENITIHEQVEEIIPEVGNPFPEIV